MIVNASSRPYVAPIPVPLTPYYSVCLASARPAGYVWQRLNNRNDSVGLSRKVMYLNLNAFTWYEQEGLAS